MFGELGEKIGRTKIVTKTGPEAPILSGRGWAIVFGVIAAIGSCTGVMYKRAENASKRKKAHDAALTGRQHKLTCSTLSRGGTLNKPDFGSGRTPAEIIKECKARFGITVAPESFKASTEKSVGISEK